MFDLIGCYVIHSICIYIQYLSYNPVYLCMSLYQSIKITPTNMYIARARVQFNINTGVYITTGSYQMVWQLSRATWALSLELFILGQSQWYGMNMLDIWQLTTLPQSECHEFMVGYMCFHVPNQNINTTSMYIPRARAQFKIWQGMKKLDNCSWRCWHSLNIMSLIPTYQQKFIGSFVNYVCFPVPGHQRLYNKYVYHRSQGVLQNYHTQVLKFPPFHFRQFVSYIIIKSFLQSFNLCSECHAGNPTITRTKACSK